MPASKRNKKPFIYLASQSPRRKIILKEMQIVFRVVSSNYHEKNVTGLSPKQLVMEHALGKAKQAVVPKSARFILAADTLVDCRGKILGKPKTKKEAFRMLQRISGSMHRVYTGVVLWDRESNRWFKKVDCTKVYIKKISHAEILNYMKNVYPFDKAGAYAIQEGPKIVTKIEGSYSNVMGLPKEVIKKMLLSLRAKRSNPRS